MIVSFCSVGIYNPMMEIIIAGAGIGGLTAGLCLQQAGYTVTIVERAAAMTGVGAGIQCGANAVHVFNSLGLLPEIQSSAVQPSAVDFRDCRSGESLYKMLLGKSYTERYGAPYLHLHRADLLKVLEQAFLANKGSLHLDAPLSSFTEMKDHVCVYLEGDRALSADCLIGADGIKSKVRELLFGPTKPRFTGNVAWRGTVPASKLPNDFMETVTTNFVGPNKHMVIYYVRGGELVNFVGVVENAHWTEDSWTAKAPWEELHTDFQDWHPTVETLVNAMQNQDCFRWALFDHEPMTNWSSKRVSLLGDAAHATLPFMASGAAMAIEDARILQRALSEAVDISEALQLYQRNRIARTTRVQAASARFGKIYHVQNRVLRKITFSGVKAFGGKQESFLPNYNACSVELT